MAKKCAKQIINSMLGIIYSRCKCKCALLSMMIQFSKFQVKMTWLKTVQGGERHICDVSDGVNLLTTHH